MIRQSSYHLAVLLLALALAGCGKAFPDQAVIEGDRPPPADHRSPSYARFAALDRNGDGVLERNEAEGHWTEIFDIIDAKGDGKVTAAEFMALPSPRMTARVQLMEMEDPERYARFMRLDRDGDGVITLDEFLAARDELFDLLDRNHDGVLSPEELGVVVREQPANLGNLRLPPSPPPQLPATSVPRMAAPAPAAPTPVAPAPSAPLPKPVAPTPPAAAPSASPPPPPPQLAPTRAQPPAAPAPTQPPPPPPQLPPTRVQPPAAPAPSGSPPPPPLTSPE